VSGKLRVGVVGAGWWAVANHIPILKSRPDVELVSVCRIGGAELAKVQSAFGVPYGAEDFAAMLDEAPMDALVVASPHSLHGMHAIAALEKGIHVLVEKPMTVSASEARAIAGLAREKSRHVLVPYGWNFKPYFAQARVLVRSGRIGRIRHVSAQMASPIGDLMTGSDLAGTEKEMFRPDPETWANPQTGGYGWGQLVHLLGGLFYVTDLLPKDVFAFVGRSDLGADLYNAAALRFADDATGALSGSATVPAGAPFQVDIRLFGDLGMLLLDVERERLSLRRHDGDNLDVSIGVGDGAYTCAEPVNRFVDLCLGKEVENCGDAWVGLRSVEVVEAMLRSAKSGRVETTGDPDARESMQ
jgi:predicted dehydrogenase